MFVWLVYRPGWCSPEKDVLFLVVTDVWTTCVEVVFRVSKMTSSQVIETSVNNQQHSFRVRTTQTRTQPTTNRQKVNHSRYASCSHGTLFGAALCRFHIRHSIHLPNRIGTDTCHSIPSIHAIYPSARKPWVLENNWKEKERRIVRSGEIQNEIRRKHWRASGFTHPFFGCGGVPPKLGQFSILYFNHIEEVDTYLKPDRTIKVTRLQQSL